MQITGYDSNDFWSRDGRWIKGGTWNVLEHSGTSRNNEQLCRKICGKIEFSKIK